MLPDITQQPRDAHGRIHDMESNRPHRVPLLIDVLRSPCWKNDKTECFGVADVCDCHPGPGGVAEELPGGIFRCRDGEPVGAPLVRLMPDCRAFTGYQISANATQTWMQCRRVEQHGDIGTRLQSGRIFQTMFHRLAGSPIGPITGCNAGMMTECSASVVRSTCNSGYFWVGQKSPDFYNDDQCRSVFHFCEIADNTAQLMDNNLFPNQDKGVLAAKNAVLAVMQDGTVVWPDGRDLAQLDYAFPVNGNRWLDYWSRGVNTPDDMPCDDPAMVVAHTFPNSYLKNARCPVHAELVIVTAFIEMSLVPYKVDQQSGPCDLPNPDDRRVLPYTRVRITAQCGVRATLPGGECVLIRPWIPKGDPGHSVALSIINPGPGKCASLPTVFPDVDQIIYVDEEGRVVQPPLQVEWLGYLGAFSDPPIENRWSGTNCLELNSLNARCLGLAKDLSGLQIPGWPAFGDRRPGDPNQIFSGHLTINFQHDTYRVCCGEPTP